MQFLDEESEKGKKNMSEKLEKENMERKTVAGSILNIINRAGDEKEVVEKKEIIEKVFSKDFVKKAEEEVLNKKSTDLKLYPTSGSSNNGIANLIQKSSASFSSSEESVAIGSVMEFFGGLAGYDNPIRNYASTAKSSSKLVEVPKLKNIGFGMDDADDAVDIKLNPGKEIRLYSGHAKMQVPVDFLGTFNVDGYILSHFAEYVSAMERRHFINGTGIREPEGIKGNVKYLGESADLVGSLQQCLATLETQYLQDAVFIMSSQHLNALRKVQDGQGRFLFDLNTKSVFGHKILVMNEVGSSVFFGNLKRGYFVIDGDDNKVAMFKNRYEFNAPNHYNFVVSVLYGAAVVDPNALLEIKVEVGDAVVMPTSSTTPEGAAIKVEAQAAQDVRAAQVALANAQKAAAEAKEKLAHAQAARAAASPVILEGSNILE
jgi:hypothetical protein